MIAVTARDREVSAPVHVPYAFRTRSVRVPLVFATRSVFLLIEDLLGGPSGHQKYGTCYKYQRNAYGTRTARVRNAYGTRPECTGLRWYHSLASLSTSLATTPAHAHVLAHMRCLEGRALNAATVSLPGCAAGRSTPPPAPQPWVAMIAVTARDRQVSAPVHVPYAFRTRSVRVPYAFRWYLQHVPYFY